LSYYYRLRSIGRGLLLDGESEVLQRSDEEEKPRAISVGAAANGHITLDYHACRTIANSSFLPYQQHDHYVLINEWTEEFVGESANGREVFKIYVKHGNQEPD